MGIYTGRNGTTSPLLNDGSGAVDRVALRALENDAFTRALQAVSDSSLDDLFSQQWLCNFHKEIFGSLHEHAGSFRSESIRVAWHVPPAHTLDEVEHEMEQYVVDCRRRLALALLRPEAVLALIGYAFWKFTYIAPFVDGNGRVANGLSILLQRRFDLPGVPLYDRASQHEYAEFVHSLRSYDTGSAAPFFEYLKKKLGVEE